MPEMQERVQDRIGEGAKQAMNAIEETTDRARQEYDRARSAIRPFGERIRAFAEARPLAAVGVAAAFGFFMGRMSRGTGSWIG